MEALPLDPSLRAAPILDGDRDDRALTDALMSGVWTRHGRGFWGLFLFCAALTGLLLVAVAMTLFVGIGSWGNNIPVAWAFGITNFVWWIGIGHAGTLISAILLLFQQRWRTSINRFAEAMTLFAVVCAGLFPLLHLGRPWFAYWLFPYPSTMGVWPQFRSPLTWDVFAVSTYLTVSFLFWYLGLVPDLATLRDAAPGRRQRIIYGIFALGWRGAARQWKDYRAAYLLLAGLATPLVVSVHTIVSWDFAVAILPGWHSTVFPPYFVAGAVFSGFAMVLTLIIPARRAFRLERVITIRHVENMTKVILATGWMVTYGYLIESFMAWYSGDAFELGGARRPRLRPLRTVLLAARLLQLPRSPDLLVEAPAGKPGLGVDCLGPDQRRDVARALRDHRRLAAPRLRPVELAHVRPHLGRPLALRRHHRALRLLLPALPALRARGVGHRGEGARARARGGETVTGAWVMGSFATPHAVVAAARALRRQGHEDVDTYSPFPIEETDEALGLARSRMPILVAAGGFTGAASGYLLQWYCDAVSFPINVGGRPPHSPPSFIPITFELTILFGAFGAFFGLLAVLGLPRLHHPVFEAPGFVRATVDRYWISAVTTDAAKRAELLGALASLGADEITVVLEGAR